MLSLLWFLKADYKTAPQNSGVLTVDRNIEFRPTGRRKNAASCHTAETLVQQNDGLEEYTSEITWSACDEPSQL
jgi:hypothetical protein